MKKTILIVLGALLVFSAVAALILRLMPQPPGAPENEASDYLVAGSVATLVALLVLFLGLVPRSGDVFIKKRKKLK
jgi:CDP-diglyceride synthetase